MAFGLPTIINTATLAEDRCPKQPFRFLALPAEIRNAIYEIYLEHHGIYIKAGEVQTIEHRKTDPMNPVYTVPALLHACVQTAHELASLWFHSTKIYFDFRLLNGLVYEKWGRKLGITAISHLRKVTFLPSYYPSQSPGIHIFIHENLGRRQILNLQSPYDLKYQFEKAVLAELKKIEALAKKEGRKFDGMDLLRLTKGIWESEFRLNGFGEAKSVYIKDSNSDIIWPKRVGEARVEFAELN
jgi:hypothetical protein